MRRLVATVTALLLSTAGAMGLLPIPPVGGHGLLSLCDQSRMTCEQALLPVPATNIRVVRTDSALGRLVRLSFQNPDVRLVHLYGSYAISDLSRFTAGQSAEYVSTQNRVRALPDTLPKLSYRQPLAAPLNRSGLVLVYSEKCPNCTAMKPSVEPVCRSLGLLVLNIGLLKPSIRCPTESNRALYRQYGLHYTPTLLYLVEGRVIWTWTGLRTDVRQLAEFFKKEQ